MKLNWKKIGLNLLYPHLAVIICLLPISVAFLVLSLIYLGTESILAILSYLLAFYVLLVISFRVPRIITFFKTFKRENKYVKKWFSDVHLRMNISLYGSLIWNVTFAIFQLWLGYKDNSLWFYAMFVYYIFLALMRIFLVGHTRIYKPSEDALKETKKYLLCGWLMLAMNLALSVIIFFIVYLNKTFEYHMITTIAFATYTFTTLTFAIINLIRYKKYNSPVYTASKMISLISACVSILTLETTMLTVFGTENSEVFKRLMLALTGIAISIFTLVVSTRMVVKGTKNLKQFKEEKVDGGVICI